MKFTIFLCSAFIVSVENKYSQFGPQCAHSINEARIEFYENYVDYDAPDDDKQNEYRRLLFKTIRQMDTVIEAALNATSMELPKPLLKTRSGIEIVCSKELADQVREIISNGNATLNAFEAETLTTTTLQPTLEDQDRNWITYSNQGVISIPAA